MVKSSAISVTQGHSQMRRGAIGMLWVALALGFSKGLSFLSQIVMGYVLPVETYAVFGLAGTAVALIGGFQNASIAKALIQNHDAFEDLFPRYSAFAFMFGLLGAAVLVAIGFFFERLYKTPSLFAVLCITSLSVPLLAMNTTLTAALSVDYRFRDINLTDIRRSVVYYGALIVVAVLGGGAYTMAIAAIFGALIAHCLLRRLLDVKPRYVALSISQFIKIFMTLRWVLLSGFLIALSMRADFFVVGKLLSPEEIGFYTFGFMLVTSLTLPISAGISQVLMPIFAKLQSEVEILRKEVEHFSSAIVILGSALCLSILGLSSVLIHNLWDGKWDGSHSLINALVVAMPFRFLATVSGVGFEAVGQWRRRNVILTYEAVLLIVFALIGTYWAGVSGAIVAVVLQRILTGIIGYLLFGRIIACKARAAVVYLLRLYVPFVVAASVLFLFSPSRNGLERGFSAIGLSVVEAIISLVIFGVLVFLLNRSDALLALGLMRSRFSRGPR